METGCWKNINMKVSVILGHPYAESFNAAIARVAADTLNANGHSVLFHDLYAEKFDPVMTGREQVCDDADDTLVALHQKEIKEADGIIIVHPNWWGQPPAMLKGWVDRVLRENIAYTFPLDDNGGGLPIGLLKAGGALVFNTSNTPEKREDEAFGDPLERIWKDCIFDFCGVTNVERKMFRVMVNSSQEQRENWLAEVKVVIDKYFPA